MNKIEYSKEQIQSWARIGSRATYGQGLLLLADIYEDLIAISADLGNSSGLDRFKLTYPERFINVGIAEQNMIGVAAGLAKEGFKVFASSFAPFIAFRSSEQIRMNLGYMELGVKTVGIGSGLSMGFLGNSHFGLEDISIMRSIPNMTVVSPCDTTSVIKVVESAIDFHGPMYIRLTGAPGDPVVYDNNFHFEIGKSIEVRNGKDVVLIATGSMVATSMKAAELLEIHGISASVVDMHTIKPIDKDFLSGVINRGLPIYSVEEHSAIGGLGSSIADFIIENEKWAILRKIALPDKYGPTGEYSYLKEKYGLTAENIANRIKRDLG